MRKPGKDTWPSGIKCETTYLQEQRKNCPSAQKMRADIFKRGGFDAVACDTAVARLNINEPTRSIPALNYHVLL